MEIERQSTLLYRAICHVQPHMNHECFEKLSVTLIFFAFTGHPGIFFRLTFFQVIKVNFDYFISHANMAHN